MILAGDIGGTKTNLALFEPGTFQTAAAATFASREHASLEDIVTRFMATLPARPTRAAFGVAGPVKQGRVVATNLAWDVQAAALAKLLSLDEVVLLNDLEANAYGIAGLAAEDFAVLNPGRVQEGNAAVIAAGTGLGEAGMFWDGSRHRPFPCEGGHADFAPRDELEVELLRFLQGRFGRVSYERVLSGPGLLNVFEFLRDAKRMEVPRPLAAELARGDAPAAIAQAALAGKAPIAERAVDTFIGIYGAEAGNLALKMLSHGGLYLGGGIAPKLLARLRGPTFLDAFLAKGRMRPLLEAMPVKVILNERTALLGAARVAQLGT